MRIVLPDELITNAKEVRERAYAPYSKFKVGAAVITRNSNIYLGCNVECADYDGTHAEESALAAMVSAGERSPLAIVAVGGLEGDEAKLILPCGKCRQKIFEFASLTGFDIDILTASRNNSGPNYIKLSKLLTEAFGPADLGIDLTRYRR